VVADRFDVIENADQAEKNNTVSVYGYVRGTYLDKHQRVHVNGLGDYEINNIEKIEDPCPVEVKKTVKQKQELHEAEKQGLVKKSKKRNLRDKERILYAPFSNIGTMNFESTTGYINIPDKNVVFTRIDEEDKEGLGDGLGGVDASNAKNLNEGQKMVFDLQDAEKTSKFISDSNIDAPMLIDGI
jgi:ribosome biogenesis protein BMS1